MIATCTLKGSQGATTLALALGTYSPASRRVVVEADLSGGDLSLRFGLPPTPGLVSLAAASRRDSGSDVLLRHSHTLSDGMRIVLAPVEPARCRAAVVALVAAPASVLRAAANVPGTVVILDFGRVDPDPPTLALLRLADALLVVTHRDSRGLTRLAAVAEEVRQWSPRPGLVVTGGGYPADEITTVLGLPVFGSIPRRPSRKQLQRAVTALAQRLQNREGSVR